jgi:hypothetical protein
MAKNYQTQLQSHTQEAGPSSRPLLNTLIQNFTQYNYEEPQEHATPTFQSFTTNRDELLSSTPLATHHNRGVPLRGSPINIDEATLDGNDAPSDPPTHTSHSQGPTGSPDSSPGSSPDNDGNDDDFPDDPMD